MNATKYRPYPEYKDSGVEWLGRVPKHWEVNRLKFSLRLVTDKADKKTNPVALENIEGWSGRLIKTTTDFEGIGISFIEGDILFGKLRPYLAKVYRTLSSGEAVGDFHVLRPVNGCSPDFAKYQMLCPSFISVVDGTTFGAKMPRANWESLATMPFLIPSQEEQIKISDYIDRETSRIDRLIEKKERFIELLKEKRQALITHAVTKGLPPEAAKKAGMEPNPPMKDSGIEWIGEVPAHWEIKKVKYTAKILRGKFSHRPRNDPRLYDGPFPFIQTGDVAGAEKFIEKYSQTLNDEGYKVSKEFPKGTLTMTIAANIGEVAILNFDACFPDSIVGFVPDKNVSLEFLYFSFIAMKNELLKEAPVSTQGNLNIERVGTMFLSIPNLTEQLLIVQHH